MKFLALFIACLSAFGTHSQDLNSFVDPDTELYGFQDINGRTVIPAQYELAQFRFTDGLAYVKSGDQYGYIDTSGKVRIPLQYTEAGEFADGMACVKKSDYYGFINTSGETVIPFVYGAGPMDDMDYNLEFGYSFQNGLCSIRQGNNYGAIDKTGQVIIPFKYQSLSSFDHNGRAVAGYCDEWGFECTYGLLNTKGEEVISITQGYVAYDEAMDQYKVYQGANYSLLLAYVPGGKIGYFDAQGHVVIPVIYDNTDEYLEAMSAMNDLLLDGRSFLSSFNDGLLNVAKDSLWGYIDKKNNVVLPFQFDKATTFVNDTARVWKDGIHYYINRSGQCLKNCDGKMDPYDALSSENSDLVLGMWDALQNLNTDTFNSLTSSGDTWPETYDRSATEAQYSGISAALDYGLKFFQRADYTGNSDLSDKQIYDKILPDYQKSFEALRYVEDAGDPTQVKAARIAIMDNAISLGGLVYSFDLKKMAYIFSVYEPRRKKFGPYDIPFSFSCEGYDYAITADILASDDYNYYTMQSEYDLLANDPTAALERLRKVEQMGYSSDTDDEFLVDQLFVEASLQSNVYDKTLMDHALQVLKLYSSISPEQKALAESISSFQDYYPSVAMRTAISKQPSLSNGGSYYAEAAPLLKNLGKTDDSWEFYRKAFEAGYGGIDFLREFAHESIANQNYTLGTRAADKIYVLLPSSDCSGWQDLAMLYTDLGKSEDARKAKDKADDCYKAAEKASRHESKGSDNNYSYRSGSGGVYVGVNLLPLLSFKSVNRDYGFCIDFLGNKMGHEFYYEQMGRRRDLMLDVNLDGESGDKIYYTGFVAHYAMKFFIEEHSDASFYIGPCFRYKEKDFEAITTQVSDANGLYLYNKAFSPHEKQYELLLNYGLQGNRNGFSYDMYFGWGVKYIQFNLEDIEYQNSDYIITNPVIESRKADRIGLGARFGITIGFRFG